MDDAGPEAGQGVRSRAGQGQGAGQVDQPAGDAVRRVREAFRAGSSPDDFPAEHYERGWAGRFRPEDLNETGRRGLGLDG
ncbi:MAG TPA: YbiU family protein [Streptosporangiaceae bacterium]|nr:YbiU family protein [Streptosporangiaceae bacterium]